MSDAEELVDVVRQCLDTFAQALEIIEGFNRRNKNQHRLSKWWAEFSTLRRHLRKLVPELQANIEKRERYAKYKKKLADSGYGKDADARVQYLQLQLLPRTYLAFGQLTADNQHAHLGLVLMGVVAQVHQALSSLAPERFDAAPPSPTGLAAADLGPSLIPKAEMAKAPAAAAAAAAPAADDIGVAVSREEVLRAGQALKGGSSEAVERGKGTQQGEAQEEKPEAAEDKTIQKPKKKKKKDDDEFDAMFGSLEPKKARKKKKQKKGDEFDDLFGSLI